MKSFALLALAATYVVAETTEATTEAATDAVAAVADTANALTRSSEKTATVFFADSWTGSYHTECLNATNVCSWKNMETYVIAGYKDAATNADYSYNMHAWCEMKMGDTTKNMAAAVMHDQFATTWSGWNTIDTEAVLADWKLDNTYVRTKGFWFTPFVEKEVTAAWDGATGTLTYTPMVLAAEVEEAAAPTSITDLAEAATTDMAAAVDSVVDAVAGAMSMKVGDEWTMTIHRWVEWTDVVVTSKVKATTPWALEEGTAVSFKILKGASALVAGATVAMASLSF